MDSQDGLIAFASSFRDEPLNVDADAELQVLASELAQAFNDLKGVALRPVATGAALERVDKIKIPMVSVSQYVQATTDTLLAETDAILTLALTADGALRKPSPPFTLFPHIRGTIEAAVKMRHLLASSEALVGRVLALLHYELCHMQDRPAKHTGGYWEALFAKGQERPHPDAEVQAIFNVVTTRAHMDSGDESSSGADTQRKDSRQTVFRDLYEELYPEKVFPGEWLVSRELSNKLSAPRGRARKYEISTSGGKRYEAADLLYQWGLASGFSHGSVLPAAFGSIEMFGAKSQELERNAMLGSCVLLLREATTALHTAKGSTAAQR